MQNFQNLPRSAYNGSLICFFFPKENLTAAQIFLSQQKDMVFSKIFEIQKVDLNSSSKFSKKFLKTKPPSKRKRFAYDLYINVHFI